LTKGNRSKGERFELVFPPELLAGVRAAKTASEPIADFIRTAVRERVVRLEARRRRGK
jgi:hypothetical protein